MPFVIRTADDLSAGELFEDCFYHPCLCVSVAEDEIRGISLVETSNLGHSSVGGKSPIEVKAYLRECCGESSLDVAFCVYSDEVGAFARFDGAAFVVEAEEAGGVQGGHAGEVDVGDAEGM